MSFRDRFGRRDPDLGSPVHDEIMIWLDGELRSGKLDYRLFPPDGRKFISLNWEAPLPLGLSDSLPVAFADILAHFDGDITIGFEVKPEIYSIGELLRQLNAYRVLEHRIPRWVVVSKPNETVENIVRREGFGWLDFIRSEASMP